MNRKKQAMKTRLLVSLLAVTWLAAPFPSPAQASAPDSLANSVLTVTVVSGEAPFVTNGVYPNLHLRGRRPLHRAWPRRAAHFGTLQLFHSQPNRGRGDFGGCRIRFRDFHRPVIRLGHQWGNLTHQFSRFSGGHVHPGRLRQAEPAAIIPARPGRRTIPKLAQRPARVRL